MEEILLFLCNIYELSELCKEHLRKVTKIKKVKKGEILLRPGEVCRHLYFIKKGLLRCFYILREEEITDWFFWEGRTVVSVRSWYTQTVAEDFIQAIEDCELYLISYDDLEYAYQNFLELNYIGRVLTAEYLLIWHSLAQNTRLLDAAERYQLILERQPEMLQRVPLRHLATWLNMTPETLSRIRSKIN
jgi:CRP/FNR family transcriptional regulator, anaerobic regulatory protein